MSQPNMITTYIHLIYSSWHDLQNAPRRQKMLPCTEEEEEALLYFILLLLIIYRSLSTLFRPSRSTFLTSWRRPVWKWHKPSLHVNTRLQLESAINTIHIYMKQISYFTVLFKVINNKVNTKIGLICPGALLT